MIINKISSPFLQTLWTKVPGIVAEEDQLYVGDIQLVKNSRMRIFSLSEEGGTIITINPVIISDSGNYTCKIADTRIDQSLSFTMKVFPLLEEDGALKSGSHIRKFVPALSLFISVLLIYK